MNNNEPHVLTHKELRKTIMTLNLSIAQIDLSMTEGEYSVDGLIDSFNYMRSEIERMKTVAMTPNVSIENIRDIVNEEASVLDQKFTSSIVAFQFYDKLSQRLHHVSESLSVLTDIISAETRSVDAQVWDVFLKKMERYASMQEEYELFELIFKKGVTTQNAVQELKTRLSIKLAAAREKHKADAPDFEDDIELF